MMLRLLMMVQCVLTQTGLPILCHRGDGMRVTAIAELVEEPDHGRPIAGQP